MTTPADDIADQIDVEEDGSASQSTEQTSEAEASAAVDATNGATSASDQAEPAQQAPAQPPKKGGRKKNRTRSTRTSRSPQQGEGAASPNTGATVSSTQGIPKSSPFAKILPNAERVRIERRQDDGKLQDCGTYGPRDIGTVGDLNTFIRTFMKPRYGSGQYYCTYIGADGSEKPGGEVYIAPERGEQSGGSDFFELLKAQDEMDRKAQERAQTLMQMAQPQNQPDPMDQLLKLKQLEKQESGGQQQQGGGDGGMMMMVMMQQMQQQQQQQMQQIMQLINQPKQDDGIKDALRVMGQKIEKLEEQQNQPPIPPPQPAPPPQDNKDNLIQAIMEGARLIADIFKQNQQPQRDPIEAFTQLQAIMEKNRQDWSMQDMMEFIKTMKTEVASDSGADSFRKQLDNIVLMQDILNKQAGGGEGFGDKVLQLFEKAVDSGGLDKLVDGIRSRQQGRGGAERRTSEPRQMPEQTKSEEERRLPAGFDEYDKAIRDAETDSDLISAVIESIYFLRDFKDWKRIPHSVLQYINNDEADKALEIVKAYLHGLAETQRIDEGKRDEAIAAFERHMDVIAQWLSAVIRGEAEEEIADLIEQHTVSEDAEGDAEPEAHTRTASEDESEQGGENQLADNESEGEHAAE